MLTLEPFCTVPVTVPGELAGVCAKAVDASRATSAAASFPMRVIVTSRRARERQKARDWTLHPASGATQRDGSSRGSCYYRPTLRALCAWCQRDGGPSFLGDREPFDDDSETHGVCRRHLQYILSALPSHSFPAVTYLVVARPGGHGLHDHLDRSFLGVRGVKAIMDRRDHERPAPPRRASHHPRPADRRQPRGITDAPGYPPAPLAATPH